MDSETNTDLFQKILFLLLFVAGGALAVTQGYQIPKLEKENQELREIKAKLEIEYKPGRVDTLFIRDTIRVKVETESPIPEGPTLEDPEVNSWTTEFNDGFMKGSITSLIRGQNPLLKNSFSYQLLEPIESYYRVDTLKITITRSIPEYIYKPRPYRLQAGLGVGFGLAEEMVYSSSNEAYVKQKAFAYGFGPQLTLLTPGDNAIGYKYDALNNMH